MNKSFALPLFLLFASLIGISFLQRSTAKQAFFEKEEAPSEAGAAFLQWGLARTFPDGIFHTEKYTEALAQMRLAAQLRGDRDPVWEDLGPKNIGGRTLCLAINPVDTNVLWLGSASGGIWKSTVGGRGPNAWHRVETGFPVLGVSSIALDPTNPNIVYAGTGEVYNVENSAPNVAIRVTRGTYGIGILKSTDGGATWSKSLDWSYGQLRGVQDIKINPKRAATLFAATTEGLLRSWDAGAHWHTVHNKRMAVDIEIDPVDTNRVFVTHGSLDDQDVSGVYRSTNGGNSFSPSGNNMLSGYSGKTLLTICLSNHNILYASVGNAFQQVGLYKTTDGGDTWTLVNSSDVCQIQGWYSHDVIVHPNDPNRVLWFGIDGWKSTNGGMNFQKKTYWNHWTFGDVPAGGPEGPPDYIHADNHRAYFTPDDPTKIYVVNDGGLFVSHDGGETWSGRNGGYQTQQFYANLSNSSTSDSLCIGGMQDNATAIYHGSPSWRRVIGGDGECTAIRQDNDQVMFGSSQYLNMLKSTDGGQGWYNVGFEIDEDAAFNGPFEIAPTDPDIMYAGAASLWRSEDGGESWSNITGPLADGDAILSIAVCPDDPDLVYCSTAPTISNQARVFKINVQNQSVTEMTGLPNRLCMDLAFYPGSPEHVICVFAGFNTKHVWETVDDGISWHSIDNGLPDVPTNCILIDPNIKNYYIGNDLGVWHSATAGQFWDWYSAGAPQAMLAMHLSATPNNKLRVATYGLGVWQTNLAAPSATKEPILAFSIENLRPNPAQDYSLLDFVLKKEANITLKVLDINGKEIWHSAQERLPAGAHTRRIPVQQWPAGTYGVVLETAEGRVGRLLMVTGK